MKSPSDPITIGLFGSCGGTTWRDRFTKNPRFQDEGYEIFNPQKDDWSPEDAEVEAEHLLSDDIILFPVTHETFGMGSLAETGFSIMSVLGNLKSRYLIVMVDPKPDESLRESDPAMFKASCSARALVRAHLRKLDYPNVFLVDSLDAMEECLNWVIQAEIFLRTAHMKKFWRP